MAGEGGEEERPEAAPKSLTFSGGRHPRVCSQSQRGSRSGSGLSNLGPLGAAGKGSLPDESTGEPEVSDQVVQRTLGEMPSWEARVPT